jgi:hypothetical protein
MVVCLQYQSQCDGFAMLAKRETMVTTTEQSPVSSLSRRQIQGGADGQLPDSFFGLQGSAASEEPTDAGAHKYDYLAEAHEGLHDK